MAIKTLEDFFDTIEDLGHRARMEDVINWVKETYPQLELRIAWNQPIFTDHATFIIGFSVAKHHISIAPEGKPLAIFRDYLDEHGIDRGKSSFGNLSINLSTTSYWQN